MCRVIRGRKPNPSRARTESRPARLPSPSRAGDPLAAIQPDVSLSNHARELWDEVVPSLQRNGILTEADVPLLVEFCEALASARQFRALLGRTHDKAGAEEKRLRSGYAEMMRIALSIGSEYGISAAARVRVGLMRVRGASLLEQWEASHAGGRR